MKTSLFVVISLMPVITLADDAFPKRLDFNRYQAVSNRSPFAIATVTTPAATSGFVKGIYVTNVTCIGDDCSAIIASASDRNFEIHIKVKRTDIQWNTPK